MTLAKYRGHTVTVTAERKGWLRGKEGYPAKATMTVREAEKLTAGDLVTFAKNLRLFQLEDKIKGNEGARVTVKAVSPPEKADTCDVVIALRQGFDGYVCAAIQGYFGAKGKKIGVIDHEKGPLLGLNGIEVRATHTYDDGIKLSDGAVVVAPGGVWPEKAQARQATQPEWVTEEQATRDEKRMKWILERYKAGTRLMTVGLDSLRVARDPIFKGKRFACSDQSLWWFPRKTGGGYAGAAKAVKTTERLVSVKSAAWLHEGLKLLGE
jgi:hypothetical protein